MNLKHKIKIGILHLKMSRYTLKCDTQSRLMEFRAVPRLTRLIVENYKLDLFYRDNEIPSLSKRLARNYKKPNKLIRI